MCLVFLLILFCSRMLNRDEVMNIWRLGSYEDFVGEMSLYLMHSVILSQWRECRMGVI